MENVEWKIENVNVDYYGSMFYHKVAKNTKLHKDY